MTQKVQIIIDGKTSELPVLQATMGLNVVDVRGLISEGIFTYDPGFLSTASCDSSVTFIDGEAGILLYRGYPIEQLAAKSSHLEVCYLLLNGELPSAAEFADFEQEIRTNVYRRGTSTHFRWFQLSIPSNVDDLCLCSGISILLSRRFRYL